MKTCILESDFAEPVQGFRPVSLSVISRVQHDSELSVAMMDCRQADVEKLLQSDHGPRLIRVTFIG